MSSAHMLTRPVRRYLMERLERLYEALSRLGERLRESIASIVGEHVGDVVRETVQAVLEQRLPDSRPRLPSYREPGYREQSYREPSYRGPYSREPQDPRYGAPQNPGFWYDDEPEEYDPPDPPPTTKPMIRRWSFLATALQALGWWIKSQPRRLGRISMRRVVGIGAAAGLAALVFGPMAGIISAIAGSALFLTHLADSVRDAVGALLRRKTP
jgi:hypothetical protein